MTKSLLDHCEPFFQEVSALLRSAGDGSIGYGLARNRLKDCLNRIRDEVQSAPGNIQQDYFGNERMDPKKAGVEQALWFFADDVVENSQLPFAAQWQQEPLARELGGFVNGKTQFFADLQEAFKENPDLARQRLAVYYTCLCLGFAGVHRSNPKELRDQAERIYGLLGDLLDRDPAKPICQDAYEVDESVLYRPVRERITFIGSVLLILVFATLVVYYFLYRSGTEQLRETLQEILVTAPAAEPRAGG